MQKHLIIQFVYNSNTTKLKCNTIMKTLMLSMIITFAWIQGNAMNDPIKLADKSLSNQQYSSAIYYYSLAIEANEVNATLYFKRARVYLFMNKYEEYLQDIETAISLDPKLPLKLDESTLKELKVF